MKAIIYNKKGASKWALSEVEKPTVNDDAVLVRVHAVSLNAADYRSAQMGMVPKHRIYGADVAGTVETVGKNVKAFEPGDAVMGDLANFGFGGLAEFVAAPEKAWAAIPQGVSFEAAATLPLAATTALQALRNLGRIETGKRVLIVGSAGSVGSFAVQLAKHLGAEVTGVCSANNVAQTLELGADTVIDYSEKAFLDGSEKYDLILGVNGNYPLLAYRKCLTSNGRYVMVGGSMSQIFKALLLGWLFSFGSKKMKALAAKPNSDDLIYLGKLLETGALKPVIDRRYALEETGEAMDYVSQGHARGKVVISVRKETT